MLQAIHRESGTPIVAAASEWVGRQEELRALTADLVCPHCRGTLHARLGEIYCWHFAHAAQGCPLSDSNHERVLARGLLYRWLAAKKPTLPITIEEVVAVEQKSFLVDCTTTLGNGSRVAYVVFTRNVRSWSDIIDAIRGQYSYVYTLFHHRMFKPVDGAGGGFSLSPLQRDVLHHHEQPPVADPAKPLLSYRSIHFLNPEKQSLVTFRETRPCLFDHPYVFQGERLDSPMAEIRIAPRTGEIVHLVETGKYARLLEEAQISQRREAERLLKKTQAAKKRELDKQDRLRELGQRRYPVTNLRSTLPRRQDSEEIFCERCGALSATWVKRTTPGWCICEMCK